MTKVAIGKRRIIQNIGEIWPKESEFSDRLSSEAGAELLAQDLVIEIENARREAKGAK